MTIEQKAEQYAERIVPNAGNNDAPYFTSSDRWQDNYDAYLAGAAERNEEIEQLKANIESLKQMFEQSQANNERLKKDNEDLKKDLLPYKEEYSSMRNDILAINKILNRYL